MKALKRFLKLIWKFPKLLLLILIVGFIARSIVGECIVSGYNTVDLAVSATGLNANNMYGQWIDTRVSLQDRDQLAIETEGTIFLASTAVTTINDIAINSRTEAWTQVSGITLRGGDGSTSGDLLKLDLGALDTTKCTANPNGTSTSCSALPTTSTNAWRLANNNTYFINGKGLMGVISTTAPSGSVASQTHLIKGGDATTGNWGTSTASAIPNGGYNGPVKKSGNLYLRIDDSPGAFGDNTGGYTASITVTPDPNTACQASKGVATSQAGCSGGALEAIIANSDPINGGGTRVSLASGQFPLGTVPGGSDGTLWLRVVDTNYQDNSGSYAVHIKSMQPTSSVFSTLINDGLIKPVKNTLFKAIPNIYNNLTGGAEFIKTVQVCLILYIIFYAISFTVGLINASQTELVIRALKIGVMLALINPDSWDFFHRRLFLMFIDGGMWMLNNLTGAVGSTDNPFFFVDDVLGQIFNEDMIFKLLAISMTLPVGLLYTLLIIDAVYTYIITVFTVILGVAMAMIGLALMLTIAPFCIAFFLFRDTQQIFKSWISALFRYALEPVFVLGGLLVINEMLSIMFHKITDVPVCWGCAFNFTIPGMDFEMCFQFWVPWGYDSNGLGQTLSGLGFTLTNIVIFEILTKLLREYVDYAPRLTAKLTGMAATSGTHSFGKSVAGFTSASEKANQAFSEKMKSFIGKDQESMDRHKQAKDQAKAADAAKE